MKLIGILNRIDFNLSLQIDSTRKLFNKFNVEVGDSWYEKKEKRVRFFSLKKSDGWTKKLMDLSKYDDAPKNKIHKRIKQST